VDLHAAGEGAQVRWQPALGGADRVGGEGGASDGVH
jgi:hypothetical protein